ncbi:prealbumin-like fold domain-containing protein [Arthrobacter sp. N1]|uniref:DUF7933 domain-containing protein n=1 Tax=Arthrobacter sp. N1 TaxID=619291 RepID=UPI003BAFBAC5
MDKPKRPKPDAARSGSRRPLGIVAAVVALVIVSGGWGPAAAQPPGPADAVSAHLSGEATSPPEPVEEAGVMAPAPPIPEGSSGVESPAATPTSGPTSGPPSAEPEPEPDESVAPAPAPSPEPVPEPAPGADPGMAPDDSAETAEIDEPAPGDSKAPSGVARMESFGRSADVGLLAAGVPESPRPAWIDTFEQGLTNAPSGITAYAANRYTISSGWATGTNCTGILLNYVAPYPNTAFCPSQTTGGSSAAREARRIADVLGQVQAGVPGGSATAAANGSTATTRSNHALVSLPYTTVAGGTTVLQSTAGIGLGAPNARYYSLAMDAAGTRCGTSNASLALNLVTGAATPVTLLTGFAAPVVPCAGTGNVFYTSPALAPVAGATDPVLTGSVRAATFTGTNTALLTPAQISSARVQLVNSQAGTGGGFGVDDVRVLDVTPALDVAYDPTPTTATTPTILTYTITNTADLYAKTDWGFAATLPAGLRVATAPAIGGTCRDIGGTVFAVTAAAGSGSITSVGGDLAAGSSSCTIQVAVVAAQPGTFSSGTVSASGLVPSAPIDLVVDPLTTITVRKNLPTRTTPADQFVLSLREGTSTLASATTTGTATGVQSAQITRATVRPGATYTISEASANNAGLGYSNAYECTRAGTVIASGAGAAGTITIPAEAGAEVTCTFTNTVQTQRLFCDTNRFYSITATGTLEQADIAAGGAPASIGTWASVTSANALGVGAGGSLAYALDRSADSTDVLSVLKWTPGGGFVKLPTTSYTTVATGGTVVDGAIVAGAVDLSSGRYLFGKFNNSRFHIWSFTESNPTATRFAYVGSFAAASASANGDMAFDAVGNLYVVGAPASTTTTSATVYTISRATLAAANGGALAVSQSTPKPLTGTDAPFAAANGVAFSPRGTLYIGNAGSAYEFDATTGERVPGTPRVLVNSTDLAGCTTPSTLTVQKNVVARQATSDQFTLTAATGSPLSTIASATTSGAATGRQAEQLGPFPAAAGSTITISETMAAGSGSALTSYRASYDCFAGGVRLTAGNATTGTVTMPSGLGVNVVCTFVNSPGPVAETSVRITKTIREASGLTRPGVDWTVGTTATATTGSATALPSEVPRQQTDAAGQATWQVLYASTASRATLVVSEVQQEGFAFVSGSCTVNGSAVPTTFAPADAAAGQTVSASLTGIAPGAAIDCALVNRPTAFLTLVKEVTFGSALPTDWTLSATGPAGALPGPSGRSGSGAASNVPVTPGTAYRLAEAGGPPTYVQTGTWRCRTPAGANVTVTASGDVTPAAGAAITCTVTNATAALTILKQVIDPRPGFQAADWKVTATPAALPGATLTTETRPGAEYVASGNPASTFDVRPGHGYTLSEAATDLTRKLAYQELRLERLSGSTWVPVAARTISAPPAGQTAVYRFVNAPVAPTTLPLTGGTSADAFYIGGGALLVAALALMAWNSRRRMRGAFR